MYLCTDGKKGKIWKNAMQCVLHRKRKIIIFIFILYKKRNNKFRKEKDGRKLDITHGFPLDFLVGMGAREIQVVDLLRGLGVGSMGLGVNSRRRYGGRRRRSGGGVAGGSPHIVEVDDAKTQPLTPHLPFTSPNTTAARRL